MDKDGSNNKHRHTTSTYYYGISRLVVILLDKKLSNYE